MGSLARAVGAASNLMITHCGEARWEREREESISRETAYKCTLHSKTQGSPDTALLRELEVPSEASASGRFARFE